MFSFCLLGFKKILGFLKKAFIVFAVYFIVISLFLYFLNKDKPKATFDPVEKNRQEIYKVINDPKLKNTKEGQITIVLYRTMLCGLIGEACTDNPKDGDKNFNHSVFGFITNLIVLPYANPPASGIYWAYSGLQNAGLIPKSYAAGGVGFSSLSMLMPLWDAFRKVSYIIIVIVIVAIGFMIMFRMKLNPQTVISVENALPKIIVALLLITFSYAIVGFLIDFMYIVIILGTEIIVSGLNIKSPTFQTTSILNFDVFGMILSFDFWGIYKDAILGIFALNGLINLGLVSIITFIEIILLLRVMTALVSFFPGLLGETSVQGSLFTVISAEIKAGKIVGVLIAGVVSLIVTIVITGLLILAFIIFSFVFLAFRIFFTLLSSLINIILYTVLAPIYLLLEAVPGQSAFSNWFRTILGNLLIFPITIFLILIAYGVSSMYASSSPTFTLPLLEGINSNALAPLMAATFLFMVPDLAKAIKQLIIGKGGLQIPTSPGAMFGAGGAILGGAASLGSQIYALQHFTTGLFGQKTESGKRVGGIFSGITSLWSKPKTNP
jgi:hypothetical protein